MIQGQGAAFSLRARYRLAGPLGDRRSNRGLSVPFDALVRWDLLDPVARAKRARVVGVKTRSAPLDLAGSPVAVWPR